MSGIDRSPSYLSATIAVAMGVVGAIGHGVGSGVAIGAVGVVVLAYGAFGGSRDAVTLGALVVFGGVILAGLGDAPPEGLLLGTAATVLAWDVGEQAINVGEQLGREAPTTRGEIAHAASSTAVAATTAGAGYVIYLFAAGGQPLAALVLLLAAALALATALRD